jgi:ATP-binding cassette subfamily C (CFTR/MRP) protein 1
MIRQHCSSVIRRILILVLAQCALPFASPFATAGTSSAQKILHPAKNYLQEQAQHSSINFVEQSPAAQLTDDRPWKKGEASASSLSRLLFHFTMPLLKLAQTRRLQPDDCFDLPPSEEMEQAVSDLSDVYEQMQKNMQGKTRESQSWLLTKALLVHEKKKLVKTGVLRLLNTAIQACPSLLVARLLRLIEVGEAQPAKKALTTAVALVAVLTAKMVTENQYFHHVVKCSTHVRGSLAGLIFDKSLRLPGGGVSHVQGSSADATLGAGGVMNLMQSDASIIESAVLQFHTLWDGALQIAIYTSLLFRYLGPPVFWGIGVLLLTIPINSVTLRLLNRLSKYENEAKDARTKQTAESISNMKLLKLQGWNDQFADDVRSSRSQELNRHVARGGIRALNTAISNAVPALVLVVILTAYVRSGRPVVASTIFTAISLFNQLRVPLFFYPMLIDALANGRIAIGRISSYLAAEDIVQYVKQLPSQDGKGSIKITSGNFLWSTRKSWKPVTPALMDVDLEVKPGEIVAVVGGVGSGKSALIKGLLGELIPVHQALNISSSSDDATNGRLDKPSVLTSGKIAYCSQEAWLPKGTIRESIVFGREFDEARYLSALRDAGLDGDIVDDSNAESLDGALTHTTDVGEGGSSISGGQRARVALARALYSGNDTTVFLLDDVLAALDANVGSIVFDRLTQRLRGSNAAAVLVTNDPSIPRRCDRVVLMGKVPSSSSCSSVVDVGTYDELIVRGHDLRRSASSVKDDATYENRDGGSGVKGNRGVIHEQTYQKVHKGTIRVAGGDEEPSNLSAYCRHADPEKQIALENCPDFMAEQANPLSRDYEDTDAIFAREIGVSNHTSEAMFMFTLGLLVGNKTMDSDVSDIEGASDESKKKLSTSASVDDSMSADAVPLSAYISYLKSVRHPILIFAMIASFLTANGAQFYQQWTVVKWTEAGSSGFMGPAVGAMYMRSLVNAAGVVSVFLWLRSFLIMKVGVRASYFLHSRMLDSVFAAPMSFFDATPSGQLMSRFGKEMETVDRGVPDSIASVLFCFLNIFMSMGALSGVISPALIVPLCLVAVLYVKTMSSFRPAARDLKIAETKTRSPIFTHFGEALRGCETIRSYKQQGKWSETHRRLSDSNLSVFYTVKALDRWLSTRLEGLGNIVVLTAAIASVFLTRVGKLKAGSAGWGLTQALAITGLLTWAVRCLTDLETNMMSVMRVQELTDIESEDVALESDGKRRRKMPRELAGAGEAFASLLPNDSSFSAGCASMNSWALAKDGWPWRGCVQFTNVSMRYHPTLPLVLNGVTLTVPAGSTLGVVGRTGSGKSSLLLTLFRLIEVEPEGRIEIDGVDIRSVGLATLRESLAIIPQVTISPRGYYHRRL